MVHSLEENKVAIYIILSDGKDHIDPDIYISLYIVHCAVSKKGLFVLI
jgi:hypothetical protein